MLAKRSIGWIFGFGLLAVLVVCPSRLLYLAQYLHTEYSQKFTTARFAAVTNGMSGAAVIELLGQPLRVHVDGVSPVWVLRDETIRRRYGTNNTMRLEVLYFSQPKGRLGDFDLADVSFGPDSTVIEKERFVTD